MTLVLPAPFGPSSPTTSPRPTVKETPSTAVRRPYRLRSPEHQTAGERGQVGQHPLDGADGDGVAVIAARVRRSSTRRS
jgi:hypothetical protein